MGRGRAAAIAVSTCNLDVTILLFSHQHQSTNLNFHLQFEMAPVWFQDFFFQGEPRAVWEFLDFVDCAVAALVDRSSD